jgi:hypothetical protein
LLLVDHVDMNLTSTDTAASSHAVLPAALWAGGFAVDDRWGIPVLVEVAR